MRGERHRGFRRAPRDERRARDGFVGPERLEVLRAKREHERIVRGDDEIRRGKRRGGLLLERVFSAGRDVSVVSVYDKILALRHRLVPVKRLHLA